MFLHIFVPFRFFRWIYVFCFPLFWAWCIYAACFTRTHGGLCWWGFFSRLGWESHSYAWVGSRPT